MLMFRYFKIICLSVVLVCNLYAQDAKKTENTVESTNSYNKNNEKITDTELKVEIDTLQKNKLSRQYANQKEKYTVGNHLLLNMFTGMLGASFIGGMIGFYGVSLEQSNYLSLFLMTGIFAGVGIIGGTTVFLVEYFQKKQFVYGKKILGYTIYSTIAGSVFGVLFGGIGYAKTKSYDSFVNGMGYGAAAGVGAGLILYFVFEHWVKKRDDIAVSFNVDPIRNNYDIAFNYRY